MIFPFPRRKKLSVVLFLSIFDVESTLAEITIKLSNVLRALAEFRVSEVIWVYEFKEEKKKWNIVRDITEYALTPPYLKKYIPKKDSLSKAGLLQPLNIPSHIITPEFVEGEIRINRKGNIGLAVNKVPKSKYAIVTDSLNKDVCSYPFYPYYSGFAYKVLSYSKFLEKFSKIDNVILGSRSGVNLRTVEDKIKKTYEEKGIYLVIGPPKHGILKDFIEFNWLIVNFITKQGVKDVRAEEALYASLTLLNFILDS
ncbi:putative RNA uridine N3 methyltransferase [Stygiolobus caldivivus]|uniref:Methylase n=1 Tax=Stygiolobus caldivivus TaxID=2824673 RepID=A0A8D5ZJI2_9CREN|nr:putative RNA uridine N3 methyltransferase [Stygiolobus caldivivus]BCU70636.1 hypothetical protein KN1_19330 [Stygiolobus caldivivus]